MLRLLTFGGLRVVRDDGSTTELANQRRRLAVLAVAAGSAPAGVTREKLLFLLWPDAEADKGRHALNQIMYNLRRELGTSPVDGVTELTLLPEVMSADLVDFRAAVARGDHATAAALYTGPFLDGFFVPGAGEFERWAEEERARTTRLAIASLDKLAAAAGTPAEQAQWTGRLVELDPLSARRALAHMRALELTGDRDAAIAYGRRYEVLAKADDDDVDPAVGAEVDRLRALPTIAIPASPVFSALQTSPAPHVVQPAVEAPSETTAEADPVTAAPPPEARSVAAVPVAVSEVSAPAKRRGAWPIAAGLTALLAAGIAAVMWSRAQAPLLPLGVGDQILLADVQMPTTDSASARAIAVALQSALQQSGQVRLMSPAAISDALQRMKRPGDDRSLPDSTALEVAEREGARYVVSLNVAATDATRLLTLRVLDPASRTAMQSYTTTAPSDGLLEALDLLVGRVRRDLGDSPDDIAAAVPLPRATTGSLEALRLLASGRDAFNRALYIDARALYRSATALDSGFAAAYAGLAAIEYELGNVREGDVEMTKALALADRLPPRERMLIQAEAERGRGDWGRAATLHRAYLIRYPQDYDVYEMLGYDLLKGKNPAESIVAYDSVRAHRRLSAATLMSIGQINVLLGRYPEARRAFGEGLHLDTNFLIRNIENERIGTTFMRLGFNDSARVVFSVMLARDESDQARGHRSLAYVDLSEGRYASAVEHLKQAIELGQKFEGTGSSEIRDRALLAATLMDVGQVTAAKEQLREGAKLALTDPYEPVLLLFTGKAAARLGDTVMARQLLDSARARSRPTDAGQMSGTTGLEAEVLLAQGRVSEGVAAARQAVAIDSVGYLVETLAYALERAGRLQEARGQQEILGRGRLKQMGKEAQQMALFAPLAIARIDAQLGRTDDARRALGTFVERWPTADANLPMITQLRARIEAQARAAAGTAPR